VEILLFGKNEAACYHSLLRTTAMRSQWHQEGLNQICLTRGPGRAGFTYRLYTLKPRASKIQGGCQQTVVPIESIAGIWSVQQLFVKNLCHTYSWNLVFFHHSDSVLITPGSSNELPWMSMWPFVKPHVDCCVDILNARWLRPAFAESYRLLRVNQARELVIVRVWSTWSKLQSCTGDKGYVNCTLHVV